MPLAGISAVATVGGGARIPLVTQRLSEHLRAPVVTTAHPQLIAAEGAALIAQRSRVVETATTITPAPGSRGAATAAFDAGQPSTTFRALAWSEDDGGEDVLPYADGRDGHRVLPAAGRLSSRASLPARGVAGRGAAAARSAGPVRPCRPWPRALTAAVFGFTLLSDTTTTQSRRRPHSRTIPRACGAGFFSPTPGAAGPPGDDRRGRNRAAPNPATAAQAPQ